MMESDDIYDAAEKEWNVFPFSISFHFIKRIFFLLHHKIHKVLLKDLFRKIVFRDSLALETSEQRNLLH